GKAPSSIRRNFCVIGSASATMAGSESFEETSIGNVSPDRNELQTLISKNVVLGRRSDRLERDWGGGRRLHSAADRFGDRTQSRDQIGKNVRDDRLFPIALGELGGIVHLDHDRIGSSGHC